MGTTADKIEYSINAKNGLKSILEENDITIPTTFGDYSTAFDTLIENLKNIFIYMDTIYINSSTTTAQLNTLFKTLPLANSYTRTVTTLTCISGVNVRSGGSTDTTAIGKIASGDIVEITGTASTGWKQINRFRCGTSYSNPLKTYTTNGYVSGSSTYFNTNTNDTVPLKKINITACSESVQNACSYSIAEKKGWEIIFSATDIVEATTQDISYTFNNCYTDNYSSSSYSNKIGTNTSTVRQGHYPNYYYYRGYFKFTSSRLNEVKSILSSSTVNSIKVYIERADSNNGLNAASYISLYACDSTGANSDALIDNTSTLARGAGKWITLSDTIKNGFISGKYNCLKVATTSTASDHYIVYNTNAKMKINYTA